MNLKVLHNSQPKQSKAISPLIASAYTEEYKMNIEFQVEKDALLMQISGEIDHRYATRIRREADRKIVTYPDRAFIIDLSRVSFMDSSGIGVIIGRYKLVRSFGSKVLIVSNDKTVGKILDMSGIRKIIDIYETLPDAMNSLH